MGMVLYSKRPNGVVSLTVLMPRLMCITQVAGTTDVLGKLNIYENRGADRPSTTHPTIS